VDHRGVERFAQAGFGLHDGVVRLNVVEEVFHSRENLCGTNTLLRPEIPD